MTVNRQVRLLTDVVAVVVCAIGALTVLADLGSPARPPIVLIGLVVGTGWALVGWISLPRDIAYIGAVTLAVGAVVPILVSVVMVETGWWHPVGTVAVLLVVAAALNLLLTVRDVRSGDRR